MTLLPVSINPVEKFILAIRQKVAVKQNEGWYGYSSVKFRVLSLSLMKKVVEEVGRIDMDKFVKASKEEMLKVMKAHQP